MAVCSLQAQQKDYSIQPVDFTQVKLTDKFWLPRMETNRSITIPASFARCESTGRVNNFIYAATKTGKFCTKYPFDDTDIYKTIEGAAFSLAQYPDPKLDAYVDLMITIISNAQESDGYLYTSRTINPLTVHPWGGKERWEKEREMSHELYNAGHLYEAAAAHYLATKKTNLLNIALKNADLVCSVFGTDKKHVAPGHEVIEMGLVKLYRITGKKEYLSAAKFFVEERGHYNGYDTKSKDPWKNGAYWQDHKPVVQQTEAEGHAVRAGYLYAAVADIAALTGDDSLLQAIDKIWTNMVEKKMYVQGGVGAIGDGERYGKNYELPNVTAYNETCAAIANVYWNYRMFLLHGESKYMDVLEKVLYNGLISGIGLDGKSFFYTNAMQATGHFQHNDMEQSRSGWFECSCCPTNVARFMPSIPGYVYAQKDEHLFVNLFIAGNAALNFGKTTVNISQQNTYPWNGDLSFKIDPASTIAFTLDLRIPGWAANQAMPTTLYHFENKSDNDIVIKVNGIPVTYQVKNGYAQITRTWKMNDVVQMMLPMEVKKVLANENLVEDKGKTALQRGPIIYCAEWVDNEGRAANIVVPPTSQFTSTFKPELLNGITVLQSNVPVVKITGAASIQTVEQNFTAIPYYSWANRGKGEMMVWFPTKITDIEIIAK